MFRYGLTILLLLFAQNTLAYERVVLLTPSAGDILIKLHVQNKVVGITQDNYDFAGVTKVGSSKKPDIQLIKKLKPDLIITNANQRFSKLMAKELKSDVMHYDPITLDGILSSIKHFGKIFHKESDAAQLMTKLQKIQAAIQPLKKKPFVVFEISEKPLMVAGTSNIVNGIVDAAGGVLIGPGDKKIGKFNVESMLIIEPDYYMYQVSAMDPNPIPPLSRPSYSVIDSQVMEVDATLFSRANTYSFELALMLNNKFKNQVFIRK